MNQLVSTIESMYSGENVVIVSPDSEILEILQAAVATEDPDSELPFHDRYHLDNAKFAEFKPVIIPPTTIASGQTQSEANDNARKAKAALVGGSLSSRAKLNKFYHWDQIWQMSLE